MIGNIPARFRIGNDQTHMKLAIISNIKRLLSVIIAAFQEVMFKNKYTNLPRRIFPIKKLSVVTKFVQCLKE